MASKKKTRAYRMGLWAEWLAIMFLRCKGYQLLAQRYKTPKGEIDLIMRRGDIIAIIEVKARRNNQDTERISSKQQQRITQAAALYLAKHPQFANFQLRFDVMFVSPWRIPNHQQHMWDSVGL